MTKQYTLKELSEITETTLVGNPNLKIANVDSLESAQEGDVSFLANPRYKEAMKKSSAGVICVDKDAELIEGKNFLICDNPSYTFQMIAQKLLSLGDSETGFSGVHPTAVVHESAKLGKDVIIGPHVVISQGVAIGDHTKILASVFIGTNTKIGCDCLFFPGSVVREGCSLGDRVILQPGAVIGSCGYGYITDPQTGRHSKLEQLGGVILEDDVEIGANSTVDRARFKATIIRKGTKLDNLVQVGHNVELGENNIIVSQTGIAGSSKTGKNVFMGGQAGVVGHVTVADNVKIATRGGVSKSIHQPGVYGGGPAVPMTTFNKRQVLLRQIEHFASEIQSLKKRIQELEECH